MPSHLELDFETKWEYYFPTIDLYKEVSLIEGRRFRFDYVHYLSKTCIEIQGGLYNQGRHSRGKTQEKDYEKAILAMEIGYVVINLGPKQITKKYLDKIKKIIDLRLIKS